LSDEEQDGRAQFAISLARTVLQISHLACVTVQASLTTESCAVITGSHGYRTEVVLARKKTEGAMQSAEVVVGPARARPAESTSLVFLVVDRGNADCRGQAAALHGEGGNVPVGARAVGARQDIGDIVAGCQNPPSVDESSKKRYSYHQAKLPYIARFPEVKAISQSHSWSI
jgi:hypothetical protein